MRYAYVPPDSPEQEAAEIAKRMQEYIYHRVEILEHAHPSWWAELSPVAQAAGIFPKYAGDIALLQNRSYADPPLDSIRSFYADPKLHSVYADSVYQDANSMRNGYPLIPLLDQEALTQDFVSSHKPALAQACAQALFAQAGARLPSFVDFQGEAGRIGALSCTQARRLCRMRALTFRRMAVRRSIDKASRTRFLQWLERTVLDKLMNLPGAPQLEVLERAFDLPALNAINTTDLEWEGLHLLGRDGFWNAQGPFAHLYLCFPRYFRVPTWVHATLNGAGEADERFDPQGSREVLALT